MNNPSRFAKVSVLIGGCLSNIFIGAVYSWGSFNIYFSSYFHNKNPNYTTEVIGAIYPIWLLFQTIGALFSLITANKIGYRLTNFLAQSLTCINMFTTSFTMGLDCGIYFFFLQFGVLNGFFIGFIYFLPLYASWTYFPNNKGFATGLNLLFAGSAGIVLNFYMALLINPHNVVIPGGQYYYQKDVFDRVPFGVQMLALLFFGVEIVATIFFREPWLTEQIKREREETRSKKVTEKIEIKEENQNFSLAQVLNDASNDIDNDARTLEKEAPSEEISDSVFNKPKSDNQVQNIPFEEVTPTPIEGEAASSKKPVERKKTQNRGSRKYSFDEKDASSLGIQIENAVRHRHTDMIAYRPDFFQAMKDPKKTTKMGFQGIEEASGQQSPPSRRITSKLMQQTETLQMLAFQDPALLDDLLVRRVEENQNMEEALNDSLLLLEQEADELNECHSLKEAVFSWQFPMLFLMAFFGDMYNYFISEIYKDFGMNYGHNKYHDFFLTLVGTFGSGANGVSRLIMGSFLDYMSFKWLYFTMLCFQLLSASLMLFVCQWPVPFTFLVMIAFFGVGAHQCMFPNVSIKIWGFKHGPRIYSFIYFSFALSNIGEYIILLFEKDYNTIFLLLCCMIVVNIVILMLYNFHPKWSKPEKTTLLVFPKTDA